MKTAAEVTPEKLRGGFYTPPALVRFCLERVAELAPPDRTLRVLEPSAGDGAFLDGLARSPLEGRIADVLAFEILGTEAEKARERLLSTGGRGEVVHGSSLVWAAQGGSFDFDLAVGNPPFVRFQFVSTDDREAAERLGAQLGVSFRGVSNLWIPILLGALHRLRAGGTFGFVLPAECFTGLSGQVARDWLLQNVEGLRFDLFPPGSFPGVRQEIAVMSGTRTLTGPARAQIRITEHDRVGGSATWEHAVAEGASWMRYLLRPDHLEALEEARSLERVRRLGEVVAFRVSITTGANDFFSVARETVDEFDLGRWARPLLPRARHAEGLIYGAADQDATDRSGARSWLLDFGADRPDPEGFAGPARYLRQGELRELNGRYKCRIRDPWYRVPNLRRGALLMSKRSHSHPRVIVNEADVLTTDTIYRGRLLDPEAVDRRSVAATFHNSLTLLTAEIEGRSFGGGVLELVPSEIGRLSLPVARTAGRWLEDLDAAARSSNGYDLVAETDRRLAKAGIVPRHLLDTLADARFHMLSRRMDRNEGETVGG